MKIKEKVRKRIIRTVMKDVLCNLCGESCMATQNEGTSHARQYLTGIAITTEGGYESAFPPDLERWRFDLCESCLGFLVSRFKLPPTVSNMMHARFVQGGKPEETDGYRPTLDMLANGTIHDTETTIGDRTFRPTPDWIRIAYAKAMAKGAMITGDSVALRAAAAANVVSEELERQRGESRGENWAMHDALSALGCPGDGTALERIRLLGTGTVDERLVGQLRQLHGVLEKIFMDDMKLSPATIDRHAAAKALDDASAYLDSIEKHTAVEPNDHGLRAGLDPHAVLCETACCASGSAHPIGTRWQIATIGGADCIVCEQCASVIASDADEADP